MRSIFNSLAKPLATACVATVCFAAGLAQGAAEEKVSRALEKPLKACNDAFQAKKYDEAIGFCKQAEAIPGHSEYDNFVIAQLMGISYATTKRYQEAYPLLKVVAESPHADARTKGAMLLTLTQVAYTLKDYPAAIEWGEKTIASGQDTSDIRTLIGQAYYVQAKYKEAIAATQEVTSRAEKAGQRPTESSLQLLFQSYAKLNDTNGQGKVIEKLVTFYPKPDYWQNAMITLIQSAKNDDRLKLQVYRLQADVGTLKLADQFAEMGQLDVEQGYPGEAVTTLNQAMEKNVFADPLTKARAGRLLEAAKKAVETEKTGVAKAEQEAVRSGNGDLLVAVGSSYLFNVGDAAKAVTLIQQGIAKGVQKIPLYDAYVTLGVAQARAKNVGDAKIAFAKVDKNDNYERLAKLWSLRAH